tara:strand:+ start:940 stop:2190 length:1251 start_codon:yes stop_codon:yes gene_type:complete
MSDLNDIPNGWVETILGEVVERITKGTTPKNFSDDKDDINYIKSDALQYGGFLDSSRFVKITGEVNDKLKRSKLKKDDILLSMAGEKLGKTGLVTKEHLPANTNQAVAIITVNKEIVNYKFIWYKLRNKNTVKYFKSIPSQSAQPNINFQEIRSLPINLPPLQEQKAIANILSAFDDKIENLQAQNETLEQTAQTIFKEWFGKHQIGDELPDGWRVGKMGEIARLKSGYAFKSKDFIETSNFKALKIKDLKGNGNVSVSDVSSIDENCTKIERVQYFRLKEGDIVLAMSGNTTGKIGVIPPHSNEIYLNQRVGKFFLKDENQKSFLYNFLMSGNFEEKILSMGYGSAQPNISPSQIENIDIFFPDDDKQKEYLKISNPIYDKVLMNNSQIQSLKKTRDTLLPKLMSGQLRINDYKV